MNHMFCKVSVEITNPLDGLAQGCVDAIKRADKKLKAAEAYKFDEDTDLLDTLEEVWGSIVKFYDDYGRLSDDAKSDADRWFADLHSLVAEAGKVVGNEAVEEDARDAKEQLNRSIRSAYEKCKGFMFRYSDVYQQTFADNPGAGHGSYNVTDNTIENGWEI